MSLYDRRRRRDNYDKSFEYLLKPAEQGLAEAQARIGFCYFHGFGTEKNYTTALEWFNKATRQGDHMGQYYMGVCYTYGYGVEKDYDLAIEWLQKAARQGDLPAKDLLKQFKKSNRGFFGSLFDKLRNLFG